MATELLPVILIGTLALYAGWRWWRTRCRDPYDLGSLWDGPPEETDPDAEAEVTADSGPYCTGCDHPNPPGTSFCRSCGRHLG